MAEIIHRNMILSVIIPVYKTENTLNRCIESVLSQNVNGMEVILVNDGSPDSCPILCNEWAERDERIKVIHKANGGLSDARNAGLDIAQGDFITFIDSDDYLSTGTYQSLIQWLTEHTNVDFLEYSIKVIGKSRHYTTYTDVIFENTKDYWLHTRAWNHAYAWNKIYRRNIFDDLRYNTGRLYEDLLLLPKILKRTRCIATTSMTGYNYCLQDNGISTRISRKNIAQLLKAEINVALEMHTHPFSKNGWQLYQAMVYRIADIIKYTFRHD